MQDIFGREKDSTRLQRHHAMSILQNGLACHVIDREQGYYWEPKNTV